MKIYVIAIVVVGVVGSIIRLLSPTGEGGGLKSHVRLAVGVATIPICIFPLISFMNEVQSFDLGDVIGELEDGQIEEYESIFEEGYLSAEEENLREGIARILADKYGIERADCYISLKISADKDGKRRLDRIFINLYGSAIWKDTGSIEKYLSSLFSCETVIAVG